jgi:hypothetical protein
LALGGITFVITTAANAESVAISRVAVGDAPPVATPLATTSATGWL